jgi:uncharacterized damage-inducible protein DinB
MDDQLDKSRIIQDLRGFDPVIAPWIWTLQDTRARTKRLLEKAGQDVLNLAPPEGGNSISSLLYHLAAIELSYLYEDILGIGWSDELAALLPYDIRDVDGILTVIHDETLEDHLERLDASRALFLSALKDMSAEEFRRSRTVGAYEVSTEWVIHHLMQHEAEHRGQIGELISRLGQKLDD